MSQEHELFNDTIANNISYGASGVTREEIENAAKKTNTYDFISELDDGFDTMIGENSSGMSGG